MRGLFLALLLVCGAATASAGVVQPYVGILIEPQDAAVPPGGVGSSAVDVTYCWQGLRTGPARLTPRVDLAPSWANVSLHPSAIELGRGIGSGVTTCETGRFELVVGVDPRAPAFTPELIEVTVRASGDLLHQAVSTSDGTLVAAGWSGGLRVDAPSRVVLEEGTGDLALHVVNVGNANTRVLVEKVRGPAQVLLPTPIVLESALAGGTATTAEVHLRVEGGEPGELVLRVTPAYALDRRLVGPATEITVQLEGASVDTTVTTFTAAGSPTTGLPVPAWTSLFGALVGLGAWRMRRS